MKKIQTLTISFLIILITNSCLKKTIEVTVIESACKDFLLKGVTSDRIDDPSCTGLPLKAEYDITFSYDGDSKCLDQINLNPKFYDANNNIINNVAFSQSIKLNDATFVKNNVGSKSVTFKFVFIFLNSADAIKFDHCNLSFSTQNQQGNPSKEASILLLGKCSVAPTNNYTISQTVNVNSSSINITLWDDGSQDGDVINLYAGNSLLLSNVMLTNAGINYTFNVPKGNTDLIITAVSQGSVGPCTCAISINGGKRYSLDTYLGSNGKAIRIVY